MKLRHLVVATALSVTAVNVLFAQQPNLGTMTLRYDDSYADRKSALNGCQSTDLEHHDEAVIELTSAEKSNSVTVDYTGKAKIKIARKWAVHWTPEKSPCKTVDSNGKEILSPPPKCFVEGGGDETTGVGIADAKVSISTLNGKYNVTWELGPIETRKTFTNASYIGGACKSPPPRTEDFPSFGSMNHLGFHVGEPLNEENPARYQGGFTRTSDDGATLTVKWDINAGPPALSVALEGCKEVGVGATGKIEAKPTEAGGRFVFRVEPIGIVSIVPAGASATVKGIKPGEATIHVLYTSAKGEKVEASQKISTLQLKGVSGTPVQIGLYDEHGKETDAVKTLKLNVLPAGSGTQLLFKPANDAMLSAVTAMNDQLQLQGVTPGRTTVQAQTSCGMKIGAPFAVEVVRCDKEVIAKLRTQETALKNRLASNIKQMSELLNDPRYDTATKEGADDIRDLAWKMQTLIAKLAAKSTGATAGATLAPEVIDKIDDARTIVEAARNTVEGNSQKASDDLSTAVWDKIADAASDSYWGLVKNTVEVASLTEKVAQNWGTVDAAIDQLAELEQQYAATYRELENVWRLLKTVCQVNKTAPPAEPKPTSKAPPAKAKSDPKPTKVTASGTPTEKVIDVPQEATKPADGPPKEPPPADEPDKEPMSIGLFAEEEKKCMGWTPVAARTESVFNTIGDNVTRMRQSLLDHKAQTLESLIEETNATRSIVTELMAARKKPAAERDVVFATLRTRLAEHPSSKFDAIAGDIEKFSKGIEACGAVLQNSFEVKIEEIRTKY